MVQYYTDSKSWRTKLWFTVIYCIKPTILKPFPPYCPLFCAAQGISWTEDRLLEPIPSLQQLATVEGGRGVQTLLSLCFTNTVKERAILLKQNRHFFCLAPLKMMQRSNEPNRVINSIHPEKATYVKNLGLKKSQPFSWKKCILLFLQHSVRLFQALQLLQTWQNLSLQDFHSSKALAIKTTAFPSATHAIEAQGLWTNLVTWH